MTIQSVIQDLSNRRSLCLEEALRAPGWDDVTGIGGLTGPCLGFAIESALLCERGVLPTPENVRSNGAEKYSKLFLRSVYTHLPWGVKPEEVTREKNDPLVQTIQAHFLQTMQERYGIVVSKRVPQNVVEYLSKVNFNAELLQLSDRVAEGALIFIFSGSNRPLLEWHIVGAHLASRTLFDASGQLIWRVDCTKALFFQAISYYLRQRYLRYDPETCSILHLRIQPSAQIQKGALLTMQDRLVTAAYMRNPLLAARFLADSIPGVRWILSKAAQLVMTTPHKALLEKFGGDFCNFLRQEILERRFDNALQILRAYKCIIPQIFNDDKFINYQNCTLMMSVQNKAEMEERFYFMEQVERLGPETKGILNAIAWKEFQRVFFPNCFLENEEEPVLLRLLAYIDIPSRAYSMCEDLMNTQKSYKLEMLKRVLERSNGQAGDVLEIPEMSLLYKACLRGDLAVAKLLIEHGADPFGQFYTKWTPLDAARASGTQELISYIKSLNPLDRRMRSVLIHSDAASYRCVSE